jgi:hypothetical protein
MQSQLVFNITNILNVISLLLGFTELYFLRTTFKKVLQVRKYLVLNFVFVLGFASLPLSFFYPQLLILTLLALIGLLYVFDGSYNGGSDYMNFLVTLGLTVYVLCDNENIKMAALLYIGAQAILSYFMAGLTKALKPNWRSGESLKKVIEQSHYLVSTLKVTNKLYYVILSWLVIITELGILAGFLNFYVGLFLIIGFLIFHAINIQLLKLNRFFFAWVSSYACMAFCFYQASKSIF